MKKTFLSVALATACAAGCIGAHAAEPGETTIGGRAFVDLTPLNVGRLEPFVGVGGGLSRQRVSDVLYGFPELSAQPATTTTPGGSWRGFAWDGSAGVGLRGADQLHDEPAAQYDIGRQVDGRNEDHEHEHANVGLRMQHEVSAEHSGNGARGADHDRARLSEGGGVDLVRHDGAGANAVGHTANAATGNFARVANSGSARAAVCGRRRAGGQHAGRVRRVYQTADCKMGQGTEGSRSQSGIRRDQRNRQAHAPPHSRAPQRKTACPKARRFCAMNDGCALLPQPRCRPHECIKARFRHPGG